MTDRVRRMPIRTGLALVAAVAAWGGLVLQLYLIIRQVTADGGTAGFAIWRYVGYFTIIVNGVVAQVATAMAFRPGSPLAGPRPRLVAASAVAVVGITYSVALRHVWDPKGLAAVADHTLHDVSPVLFLVAWLASEHGRLRWRDAAWAFVLPLGYCIYAFIRGAADGWYAYWFLNPSTLGPAAFAGSAALLTAVFAAVALVLVAIDRRLANSRWAATGASQAQAE
jgi:hypothetical protein